jgi:hypothetical protein
MLCARSDPALPGAVMEWGSWRSRWGAHPAAVLGRSLPFEGLHPSMAAAYWWNPSRRVSQPATGARDPLGSKPRHYNIPRVGVVDQPPLAGPGRVAGLGLFSLPQSRTRFSHRAGRSPKDPFKPARDFSKRREGSSSPFPSKCFAGISCLAGLGQQAREHIDRVYSSGGAESGDRLSSFSLR